MTYVSFMRRLLQREGAYIRQALEGVLDPLVLKTLDQKGEMHGYGIVLHVQRASDELLAVEEGSLFPAQRRVAGRYKQVSLYATPPLQGAHPERRWKPPGPAKQHPLTR